MQTERNKASFGTLFGRGWKLFGRTADAGLGGLLLCQGLPGVSKRLGIPAPEAPTV